MKKKITTILLTFAIAITGINTPADKVNAETKDAKTTSDATAEAPTETKTPSATPIPGCRIGDVVYDVDGQKKINTEEGLKPYTDELYFSYWPLPTPTATATPAPTRAPVIGERRGNNWPYDMEVYTENGWKKVEWKTWDTCGNLMLTPTGWRNRYDEEVIDEYNKAALAAEAAEKAKKPHDIRIGTRVNLVSEENTTRLKDGDTTEITKGFDTEISFRATGDASPNWTSSNPEAVTITKTTQNKDKKTAVLTGKNYGTSVVTAEYNGYKISITIKVMKNEYKRNKPDSTGSSTYNKKKEKGLSHVREVFVTAKYNKKGNLVVTYTEKTSEWKNPKDKRKIVCKGKPYVDMEDENGKTVVKRYVGKFKMTRSPKKKTGKFTFTIPKKYLKKKSVDLRKCDFYVSAIGKYSKEKIVK